MLDPLHELRCRLRHLEGLGCACDPFCGPCAHILATNHSVPLVDWARMLRLCFPVDYAEPPPPSHSVNVMTRSARVAVLENRHADGVGLWHDGDLVHREIMEPDTVRAAPLAKNRRNGALQCGGGIVVSGETT